MAKDFSKYKKSTSNYVIQEHHQSTNRGEIFEKDITTIGGRNYFDKNQIPVYNSSNFIITTTVETSSVRPTFDFEDVSEDALTWNEVKDINEDEDTSIAIDVKPDVQDLRTFAYYGSCVELIRASLNHIIDTFPGELYITDKKLDIFDEEEGEVVQFGSEDFPLFFYTGDTENNKVEKVYDKLYVVDNPFDINLYEDLVESDLVSEYPLKYVCANSGKTLTDKYEVISSGTSYAITGTTIGYKGNIDCARQYEWICDVTIEYKNGVIQIYVCRGEGDDYIYLSPQSDIHIRPKSHWYTKFKNKLSLFERTLLNENTSPKYSPLFEIYKETDWGFTTYFDTFSMPVGDGGYNLGISKQAYAVYVQKLSNVAEFYDEYFCDNLYRSMTHESIKNFDWSFTREFNESNDHPYAEGGGKMQKLLRLIGREFDEIKLYIDNLAYASQITYDGVNNLPDYFLTDQLELEGWDYRHIIPFVTGGTCNENICQYVQYSGAVTPFFYEKTPDSTSYISEQEYSSFDINNLFARILKLNSRSIWKQKGTVSGIESLLALFGLKSKRWLEAYKKMTKDKLVYGCDGKKDIDDSELEEFSLNYDYDIKEYVSIASEPIIFDNENNDYEKMLDVNNSKYISYAEDAYINVNPTPWRGLLVKEKNIPTGNTMCKALYPYFSKTKEYDGNPYYQMHGGWLEKQYSLDDDYNLISTSLYTETLNRVKGVENLNELLSLSRATLRDGDYCYVRNLDIPYIIINGYAYELKDYTESSEFLLNFTQEQLSNTETTANNLIEHFKEKIYYFDLTVNNGSVIIGDEFYVDIINTQRPIYIAPTIQKPYGEFEFNRDTKPIDTYADGTVVRFYINALNQSNVIFTLSDTDGTTPESLFFIKNDESYCDITSPMTSIEGCSYCNDGESNKNSKGSHYFKLKSADFSRYLGLGGDNYILGWNQLLENDDEYRYLNQIKDYFKGNNPHTASEFNDSGYEYMSYFINLFKYAIESDSMDWDNIFNNIYNLPYYEDEVEKRQSISEWGFQGLKKLDGCNEYIIYYDSSNKIHSTTVETYQIGDDSGKPIGGSEGESYFINKTHFEKYRTTEPALDSDLIINTKIVEIIFNVEKEISTSSKFKYIDKVVIPYLTQLLPSTLIVKIKYET